jgi:ubiquinone/menaquinone biosynthesis C-methylase UbiE
MNSGVNEQDPTIHYYDGDYPSQYHQDYPENFDEITKKQGLYYDVNRYKELAAAVNGQILEICCGTGRVAIPLAQEGFSVTGVDISSGMLDQFRKNLRKEDENVKTRIMLIEQNAATLSLDNKEFKLVIIPFNSFLCIPDFNDQCKTLKSIADHLADDGILVMDVVNPLQLKVDGDPIPKPFFTRRNPNTGNLYTRFAMVDAFDENHRQRLHGWYDEYDESGNVKRTMYSVYWRPVF